MCKMEKTNYSHTVFQVVKVDDGIFCPCDFNGENSPLSVSEQREFLAEQYAAYERRYSRELGEKVVSDDEIARLVADFDDIEDNPFRERTVLKNARAYAAKKRRYEYLVTYTKKTSVENGSIFFRDCDDYPVAAAKIEVPRGLKELRFGAFIDREYYTPRRSPDLATVTGKAISFRKDGTELLQLTFYPFGRLAVKTFTDDTYHPEVNEICDYPFGEAFGAAVTVCGDRVTVKTDGTENSFPIDGVPDEVFIGGGMTPVGTWKFFPYAVTDVSGKDLDVFKPFGGVESEEFIGEVRLPFAIGTKKRKDETLRLETVYDYEPDGRKAVLYVSTIDPDGEIYVNGVKVADTCDYKRVRRDVTAYLKAGENVIGFSVNPRAPEILYWWHKHKDPYCGYGVGVAYIEKTGDLYVDCMKVVTEKVLPKDGDDFISALFHAEVYSDKERDVRLEIAVLSDGERRVIGTPAFKVARGANTLEVRASFSGKAWSPDSPYLYRLEASLIADGKTADRYYEDVGFRKIENRDGKILLNGKETIMKGALLMQFMPPYENIPVSHVLPSDEQIFAQAVMAKKMNCNTVRMHQLGYGTNDRRFARAFDRLGILCIWTTRLIDALASVLWNGKWRQKEFYAAQIKEVINSPSIVMWEGINEIHLSRADIDNAYGEFVKCVTAADETRLICPVSNIYYVDWYNDDGTKNKKGESVQCVKEWNHPLVVRSAHPYVYYLGYGFDWNTFRNPGWDEQYALLNSKKHAYIMSEYAVMGRQNPDTKEAAEFINKDSYELANELRLGYDFKDDYRLSQAYQALAAEYTTKKALSLGADGVLWCCLQGGANDASYLKPPIDFYGYPKAAFFALKNYFAPAVCFSDDIETVWGKNYVLRPVVVCDGDGTVCNVYVTVKDGAGKVVLKKEYRNVLLSERKIALSPVTPKLDNGYYVVEYEIEK